MSQIHNRHTDGIIPGGMLLRLARRNPSLPGLSRTIGRTHDLWLGSDARTSQLFRFINNGGKGDRFLYDAQNGSSRPGVLARGEGDAATGDIVIDNGYDFHGIIRDYHMAVHGRNSIDANGMALKGICHFEDAYNNAFWDGTYMTYGDGDKIIFLTFMLLNVAAHEMGHGITEYAVPGGIDYYGMGGAINEHLSDVDGCSVESWHLKQAAAAYHWLIGNGLWVPAPAGSTAVRRALRDMLNPGTAYNDPRLGKDRQPGHMKDYVRTSSDNGGVHINSGIPNRMFALFARSLEGNTWDDTTGKAAKIWYAARPNLGNKPSFGQLAYWALEACARFPGEEKVLRAKLQTAIDGVGVKADKKAIDTLTPSEDE